ncbi:ribonuclease P protein component [Ruminococcus sp. NK3A76]|uniref:ribonuclease P protein component n=1 Tax=Ruminococcus sp. NK3A76 TaxID=877411 RepID=UPI0005687A57|nr:ribonuclease P protein component [Ruminococcus sp. NK3A76]
MLFTVRLKENKGFMRAYKKGSYVSCGMVAVYFFANNAPYSRLGISVSKKIGCAVQRNRAKRIIRAAYRECEQQLPIGYDIVFVARPGIDGKGSADITRFIRSRVIKEIEKKAGKK